MIIPNQIITQIYAIGLAFLLFFIFLIFVMIFSSFPNLKDNQKKHISKSDTKEPQPTINQIEPIIQESIIETSNESTEPKQEPNLSILSDRQKEVYDLLSEGKNYLEVAMILNLSKNRVSELKCEIERKGVSIKGYSRQQKDKSKV